MHTNNTTAFNAARKTTLAAAAAIALVAAAPAFAASAPSEWAGYPASDSVQFQPQPASLANTAQVATRDSRAMDMSAPAGSTASTSLASTSNVNSTAAPLTADTATAHATNDSTIRTTSSVMADATPAPSDAVVVETTTWVLLPLAASKVDTTPATLPQWQPPAITRESVRAELLAARQSGTMTPSNEVGDSERVLTARQAFNEEQSDAIVAGYQAEYDRQVALQEAEIRRAAIEADWLQYGMAQSPTGADDPTAEVQIDVISMQPLGVGE